MPVTKGQGNPDWTLEETILAPDLLQRHGFRVPGKTHTDVQGLSSLLRALPIHPLTVRLQKFRNVDGVYLKLQQLFSLHPTRHLHRGLNPSETDRKVWSTYWQNAVEVRKLAKAVEASAGTVSLGDVESLDDDVLVSEGRLMTVLHTRRERARGLRRKVLARERKRGLACAACGKGPALTSHGSAAAEAIYEVHHVRPLADLGESTTRLSDLALLCAACHRLVHRLTRDSGRWCAVGELRDALQQEASMSAQ